MTTNPQTVVWIDDDPLMEAIAAAVWERCEQHDSGLVVDDPRNIAAVAASVAVSSAVAQSAPADRAADVASCPGRELDPNPCRCPCYGCKHHCSAHNPEELPDVEAAPTADRVALRDRIAAALADADGWKWAPGFKDQSPTWQGYQTRADAVLSVLPAAVCICGHTQGEHITVSGRLLCDACDPDSTENLTCTGFEAL